ncbi:MAG: hypothetical protein LBH26_09065, partial [Treponema sp.]|nr:hypothetical protein [Treponema sp.]
EGCIAARLHEGGGGTYLWIANPKRREIPLRVELPEDHFSAARTVLGPEAVWRDGALHLKAPARYVAVYELS